MLLLEGVLIIGFLCLLEGGVLLLENALLLEQCAPASTFIKALSYAPGSSNTDVMLPHTRGQGFMDLEYESDGERI